MELPRTHARRLSIPIVLLASLACGIVSASSTLAQLRYNRKDATRSETRKPKGKQRKPSSRQVASAASHSDVGNCFRSMTSDSQGGVWIAGKILYVGLLLRMNPAVKVTTLPFVQGIEDVFFPTETTGWIVADWGRVYSTNDRTHWTQVDVGPRDFKKVYFLNNRLGWLIGKAGVIYRTTDNGRSWQKQDSGTDYDMQQIQFANPLDGWALGRKEYSDAAVFLSTRDGGEHWYLMPGEEPAQVSVFSFINEYEGWALNNDSDILHTTDRGWHWTVQRSGTNDSLISIQFVNASEGWAVGDGILHTNDGGVTWRYQMPTANRDGGKYFDQVYFSDRQRGWALGFFKVMFTNDGGARWNLLDEKWRRPIFDRALKEMAERNGPVADRQDTGRSQHGSKALTARVSVSQRQTLTRPQADTNAAPRKPQSQEPLKSYKVLSSDTYERVLDIVFERDRAGRDYNFVLRFEPSFSAESQIVVKSVIGKTMVTEYSSLSGNIYRKLDSAVAKGGKEDAIEMAKLIEVRKREIEIPASQAALWRKSLADSIAASVKVWEERNEEAANGIGTLMIDGTLYQLWYNQDGTDISIAEWDHELREREVTGELQVVRWMNTVRRDLAALRSLSSARKR
jgi:photosystem II stability/assembly factor-like uncharacterized protein